MEREVVARLVRGVPLDGLGLGRVNGRWDLRGMRFSAVKRSPGPSAGDYSTTRMEGVDTLRGVRLEGLDLSGSAWEHLRMFSVTVRDCVLEGAQVPDLRMWDSYWLDCSLRGTDLRSSSMGGSTPLWRRSGTMSWTGVDFTGRRPARHCTRVRELHRL